MGGVLRGVGVKSSQAGVILVFILAKGAMERYDVRCYY